MVFPTPGGPINNNALPEVIDISIREICMIKVCVGVKLKFSDISSSDSYFLSLNNFISI